jgi:hypothetical protein
MLPSSDMDIKILSRDLPDTEDLYDTANGQQAATILTRLKELFQEYPKDLKIQDPTVIKGRISLLTFNADNMKVDITINKASDILKTRFIQGALQMVDDKLNSPNMTCKLIRLAKVLCTEANIIGSKSGRLPS